ncbi:sulfotransferase [Roseisalinus antarcticus]|uniref:Sulfotransferase family protein n=1 Tax=Roseisalinus antarcticus TaxID=254357 RepID=A0A1Y5TPN5_9RHOB|nr:sulfotransferase [Roseisalinus antarcticus]SLN69068.1 hypothetical protein ROA7023_03352 [Roseisalinus antarcticus]
MIPLPLPARWRHMKAGRISRVVHVVASPYKTGTSSLGHALISLGIGSAEMPYRGDLLKTYRPAFRPLNWTANQAPSARDWIARNGDRAARDLRGLTRALAPYDVFHDAPFGHNHLHPILRKALAPRARFLWINRDYEAWVDSVRRWETGRPELYASRAAQWRDDPKGRRRALRRSWNQRYARFLQLAEEFPEDCLELQLERMDDMGPLCAFYGIENTGQSFPKRNISKV